MINGAMPSNIQSSPRKRVIFIISGKGGCGKDTLIKEYSKRTSEYWNPVLNISTIDPVKEFCGYFGYKESEKDFDYNRALLHNTKNIFTDSTNLPVNDVLSKVIIDYYNNKSLVIFIHCREPENIDIMKNCLMDLHLVNVEIKTLLVTRDATNDRVYGNHCDDDADKYDFDYTIDNTDLTQSVRKLASIVTELVIVLPNARIENKLVILIDGANKHQLVDAFIKNVGSQFPSVSVQANNRLRNIYRAFTHDEDINAICKLTDVLHTYSDYDQYNAFRDVIYLLNYEDYAGIFIICNTPEDVKAMQRYLLNTFSYPANNFNLCDFITIHCISDDSKEIESDAKYDATIDTSNFNRETTQNALLQRIAQKIQSMYNA